MNKVFYLDAQRACLDAYNLGWRAYLQQRETDERRRRRERVNAGRQASALMAQADKMRAKATKARAAQNMQRRAERMLAGVEAERSADRVARLRFPVPAAVRPDPADRRRACPSRTGPPRCSAASTWPSTGAAGWWSSG